VEEEESKTASRTERAISYTAFGIAILLSVFQVYTASSTPLPALQQRGTHLALAAAIIFLTMPLSKKTRWTRIIDLLLTTGSLLGCGYVVLEHYDIAMRMGLPSRMDIWMGILTSIVILEATRRTIGIVLPALSLLFVAYAFWGNYVPGPFSHVGFDLDRVMSSLYLGTEGLFGIATAVSATMVAAFVLFGGIFEVTGGGRFFVDIARSLVGHVRGGPAKVSVISSGLFGTVSGSIISNVVVDGWITIPLMKKVGFSPEFAGAVEATASTGGMIMPPVMGAQAFVMAEMLGIPYYQVALYAAVPALLYYVCAFFSVDFRAASLGLKGQPRREFPFRAGEILKRDWVFLLAIVVLIYMLGVARVSPMKAAVWTMWGCLIVSLFKKDIRPSLKGLVDTLAKAGNTIAMIAMSCACCGFIIGVFSLTGVGLKLSSILVDISGGSMLILLVLAAGACIIFGMAGLVTPAYIMTAVMVAPALTKAGGNLIASHLFLVHYTSFADITPPVALGAYVAAGIAGGNTFRTALEACRLALPSFFIPFMFVFNPVLVLQGAWYEVVWATVTATFGVFLAAAGLQGFCLVRLKPWERTVLLAAALLLMKPGIITDSIGAIISAPVLLHHWRMYKVSKAMPGSAAEAAAANSGEKVG
jgi:TRAP transporter 4TM/12TM fusion protein